MRRAPETYSYPAWFVQGGGAPVVVGYAPAYATAAIAESIAVGDAHERGRLMAHMLLVVETAVASNGGNGLASMGEQFEAAPLTDSVPYFVKASVPVRGMRLVAMSPDSAAPEFATGAVTLDAEPPAWVRQPPAPEGPWSYAVGVSTAYFNEHQGWMSAEQHAWQMLAFNAGTRVRYLTENATADDRTVMQAKTSAELQGVQVLARWRNASSCFVLVKGRVVAVRTR